MSSLTRVVLSQLTPPASRGNVLARERLDETLRQVLDYPLTIICAGTGYGKTTSILGFIQKLDIPVFWYSISPIERDPKLFLANLFTAFNRGDHKFGQIPLRLLSDADNEAQDMLIALVNSLSDGLQSPALLVLDDFQSVEESDEIMKLMDWFVNHLPANLHVLMSSRVPLNFPSMSRWQAQGAVFEMGREMLSFSVSEVEDLFQKAYQMDLAHDDIVRLQNRTEGWAVALQAAWHNIRAYPKGQLSAVLEDERPISAGYLFDYLAEEVLDKQDPDRQVFLTYCSILEFLESDICDFLLDRSDTQYELSDLFSEGLFLEQLQPGVYRFHYIFKTFLRAQLQKKSGLARDLHRKIASYFTAHEDWQEAISHLLRAGDYPRVTQILDDVGSRLLQRGLHQSVGYFLGQLPADLLNSYAYGNYLLAEVQRNEANFDLALESYRAAQRIYQKQDNRYGTGLAIRGQAQVYLDTLRPSNASQLLTRALEMMDAIESPHEVSGLLTQIAENQLNQGETAAARESLARARDLSLVHQEEQDFIQARLLLRTGQLKEGLELLDRLEAESEALPFAKPQRFHRDTSLLISLYHALMGNQDLASKYALKGLEAAEQAHAKLGKRIGTMRLAHAKQLDLLQAFIPQISEDIWKHYEESMHGMDIARINIEPLWGMCRLVGYAGNVTEAQAIAEKAFSLALQSGDVWIGMLVRVSLGAGLALAGALEKASSELALAETIASQVGDELGRAACLLWQAYVAHLQGYKNSFGLFLEQALPLIKENSYDFLLTKRTFLGPNDVACFMPLLLEARNLGIESDFVNALLRERDAEKLNYHPGCGLQISTLGPFEVYLSGQKLGNEVWKREKAKHLLQILAARYPKPVSKQEILTILWPESDSDAASNALKVALSALNNALEPARPSGEQAYFVLRDGDSYFLNDSPEIVIDHILFEDLANSLKPLDQRRAIELYRGKLLEEEVIQEAFMVETQYFHRLYLACAANLLESYYEAGAYQKVVGLANELIQIDPLFETAYLYQMQAFKAEGQPSLSRQVYVDASKMLKSKLGEAYSSRLLDDFAQTL